LNGQGNVAFEATFFDGQNYVDALIQQKESGEPTLTSLVLSDQGEVAFVLSDFASRIFVTRDEEPRFAVGAGWSLEFGAGDVRPVARADLVSGERRGVFAGNEDGLPSGFNNSGQMAFRAETGPSAVSGNSGSAVVLATPVPGDPAP
jgi:hypothetical protein